MNIQRLFPSFPWSRYSKKLSAKIEKPRSGGCFTLEASEARAMHLASGRAGTIKEGNAVALFWLVDPEDGIIVDAKFQAYGQSALIGAAEIVSELVIGKNYDQAKRISSELIDSQVRDRPDLSAFPPETFPHLNLILEAIDAAADTCAQISLAPHYISTPLPPSLEPVEGGYPGWEELSNPQKIALIEELIARDIRPYIELDAGGVRIVRLEGFELYIAYSGSCTSCFSATGTTLSYIQQHVRAKIHPDLHVIPEF